MSSNRAPVVHIYPRGTCKAPAFYFRGAEPLTEPEYLTKQLSVARSEYRKAKKQYEKEVAEYEDIDSQLSQKDGYTVALASALGEESYTTEENARLRRELADLTKRIESVERSISHYKSQQNTSLVSGLHKERAFYHAEIENLRIGVLQGIKNMQEGKEMLGNIVNSNEFTEALQLGAELSAVQQLYGYLRTKMNKLFKKFSNTKPAKNIVRSQEPELTALKALAEQKHQMTMELDELRNEKFYTEAKTRTSGLALIDQIEAMNQVLVSMGGEAIDCQELRAHFLPRKQPEEQSEEAKPDEEKGRPTTRTARRTKGGLPSTKRPKTATGVRTNRV